MQRTVLYLGEINDRQQPAWRKRLEVFDESEQRNVTMSLLREMKEKFREQFEVIRSDVLRANYGMNPWQERNQVVTSISCVSRIDDAKDSLLRSRWDLIVVDEAHKMAPYSADKKTLAYRLGESLSSMRDHFLLMTALNTRHPGG